MENNKIFIKPVSIEGTMMIYQQMTNCICKVKNNQKIGTGFFCKIPYQNNNKINVLITSYQILNEDYLNNNNQITLLLGDYNQQKLISLYPGRNTYYNKEYNTTIIELNENDYINNFIELDDNLFRNDLKTLYKNESIYTLHYLNGGKALVSYGILEQLNNYNIKHSCEIQSGAEGAPILNLTNNKLIGISLETKDKLNYNEGIILKYPIEDFINQNNIKMMMQQMQQMQQMQMFYMMMNNNNIKNEAKVEDEEWLKGFQKDKIEVVFKTAGGLTHYLNVNYGTTINEMLVIFLKRFNRLDLIGNDDKICFLNNGRTLKFGDKTPVKQFFGNTYVCDNNGVVMKPSNIVTVIDVHNLIVPTLKFTFHNTSGNTKEIHIDPGKNVKNVINEYLKEINKVELIKSDKLCFLYNAKEINSEDMKIRISDFFKVHSLNDDGNINILVVDPNNLNK